jgi:hypothetical protein
MEQHNRQQRLIQRIAAYLQLSELFKYTIPVSPPLIASIYKGVNIGKIWGEGRFLPFPYDSADYIRKGVEVWIIH